jgi:hypothetical protein
LAFLNSSFSSRHVILIFLSLCAARHSQRAQ